MNKRLSIAELLNVSALIGHVCPGNFREGLPIVGMYSCPDTEYATCADCWHDYWPAGSAREEEPGE